MRTTPMTTMRGLMLGAALLTTTACGSGADGDAANGSANAASSAAAEVPDSDDAALDYARLFMPAGQVAEQGTALFRQTFDIGFASQPANQALEREHPGTKDAARDAGAATMRRVYEREVPVIQQRVADAVRPLATTEELRDINRFMRSDTARAMQQAANAQFAGKALDRAGSGDMADGPALRGEDVQQAGTAAVSALTPAQTADLQRFAATPAGQALNRMSPVATQVLIQETNALATRAQPEIDAAIRKVVQERTGG